MNINSKKSAAVFLIVSLAFIVFSAVFLVNYDKGKSGFVCPVSITTPYFSDERLPTAPGVYAKAYALIDAKSGALLAGKNENMRLPMASTTKIMTALVVLDLLPSDRVVDVPKAAVGVEGSSIYLAEHEKITVSELLYGMLLESGNDAATALAVEAAGSVEEFACLMNAKAAEIGLIDTHFTNPHGLYDPEHYTTAYELSLVTARALQNEDFRRIVSTKKHSTENHYYVNHNRLLSLYDGASGVKTGFTKIAGRCLVSSAVRDGEEYIVTTLDDGNDWKDHMALLDHAFASFDSVEIAAENSFGVCFGEELYTNPEGIYLTVPDGSKNVLSYNVEINEATASVEYYVNGTKTGTFGLSHG